MISKDVDTTASAGRNLLGSAGWNLSAQALMLPAGLAVLVYLTRTLDPTGYGRYATIMAVLSVIEIGLSALVIRPAVRLVSDAADPRAASAGVLRWALALGAAAGLLMALCAEALASALNDATLASGIRLAAIDVPLFVTGHAYLACLAGLGRFRRRAAATAIRWPLRLVLSVLMVELGFGVHGALLAVIGASVAELAMAMILVPVPITIRSGLALRDLAMTAGPLAASAVAMRVMDGGDLLALNWFGADGSTVGSYAAAANFAIVPGLIASALFPVVMASLVQLSRQGEKDTARRTATALMSALCWMVPLTLAGSLAADPLVTFLFGADYHLTGPLLTVLLWAALGRLVMNLLAAVLAGLGRPMWAWWAAGPPVLVALLGYAALIPWLGASGAAWATTCASAVGVGLSIWLIGRRLRLALPEWTLTRVIAAGLLVWLNALVWPDSGLGALASLPAAGVIVAALAWTAYRADGKNLAHPFPKRTP